MDLYFNPNSRNLAVETAEDSFLDNFTSAAWKKKAEIIKREVDKGQKRLIYDIDE